MYFTSEYTYIEVNAEKYFLIEVYDFKIYFETTVHRAVFLRVWSSDNLRWNKL